jgi:lipocalin
MYGFYGPNRFYGVQIDNGSHTDVIEGDSLFARLGAIASSIIVKPSPPGGKEAVRTFASGWINDIYSGEYGPTNPGYGIYGKLNDGTYVPNESIVMGEAGATTLPAPPPVRVDPNLPPTENYLGTWYEQGSVKQFFYIALDNTSAVYRLNPDGTIKVENSGNYFGPNGPSSNITGSAVPVNAFNTRLNVGFFFGTPSSDEPGNYWILDYAPDYSWAIVSDSSGRSGFILTREQTIDPALYDELVARAKQLGVTGRITPTAQYPTSSSAAALPGPASIPATVVV